MKTTKTKNKESTSPVSLVMLLCHGDDRHLLAMIMSFEWSFWIIF